ncbi:hypothetical protein BKA93DRAFT_593802 [Sparassis latifolia]|uniref:Uncharacterized protein n=1 Tax=Sparassis crispa TaxID=139825 RepID=A0A401GZP7_9APHY|nr:hypothetical protein SCP_1103220 [Sparassis crispa]GBE87645.1 hypothetical protein SCP_1103220 [Sparassis crispa]
MVPPLSVSSFPDLLRLPTSDLDIPAPPSSDPVLSIKKRRRHPSALFLKTTDGLVQGHPFSAADSDPDDSPSSPILFRQSDELERRRSLRTDHIRRYKFPAPAATPGGTSTSPETASFPSTPRSTKESIACFRLSRSALSRSPSPDMDITHCSGSWVDTRGLLPPLPPLPNVSKIDEKETSTIYYVEDDESDNRPVEGTADELEFVDPSPTDSLFSVSSFDSCILDWKDDIRVGGNVRYAPTTARARSFDGVRPSLPSRQFSKPLSFATFTTPLILPSVNPHIAVAPTTPLPTPCSRAKLRFGCRGKSATAPPDLGSSSSLVEDVKTGSERARSPSNMLKLRLKRMRSQKALFCRRTPLASESFDTAADTDADMACDDFSASPSVSRMSSGTLGREPSPCSSIPSARPIRECTSSHGSDISVVDLPLYDVSIPAPSRSADLAADEPLACGSVSRSKLIGRSVEVAVATATLFGDVLEERDISDVIPRLRMLRVSSRSRLW